MKRTYLRLRPSAASFLRKVHSCICYWPPRETRRTLAEQLTIYGFWIGMFLAVVAILLAFDITKTMISAKPAADQQPFVSNIEPKMKWKEHYKPPEKIQEALERLLMGEVYEQPVLDYEAHEFYFPESDDDFPSAPRPHIDGEPVFLKWRIGAVPPLRSDDNPCEARLPGGGDTWEWNIDPQLMSYILNSGSKSSNDIAWYKIAIGMVGGYSTLGGPGLSVESREAAIDAFQGTEWTFEANYKVWNSGNIATEPAEIVLECDNISIISPIGIDHKSFIIQPEPSNAIEFILVPKRGYSTLDRAWDGADCVQKNTRLNAPPPKPVLVYIWPAWAWLMAALLAGAITATAMMKLCWFRRD